MRKTVLILEDETIIRLTLQDALQKRGIDTITAATAEEAWALLEHAPNLDVAVLDISLGDEGTGFDFGLRLKRERSEWPPEFLIHSAHQNVDYFQTALKLGAAAYLGKASVMNDKLARFEVVTQHVRALALRRALQGPHIVGQLQNIAGTSRSRDEAIERFCREIVTPELEAALGFSFLLLLTSGGKTTAFAARAPVQIPSTALDQIQSAIHARLGSTEPFIVNPADALSPSAHEREALQRVLVSIAGSAFIGLGEIHSTRLSLGLMPGEQGPEAVIEQVKLFDRFLRPAVIQILQEIGDLFSASQLGRERERRQTLLRATTDFCLSQSQLLTSLVWEAEKEAGEAQEWPSLLNLRVVADEMREAGELLVHFGTSESGQDEAEVVAVDMAALIDRIWAQEISARLRTRAPHVLRREGQCVAREQVKRVERTVSQIMSWLARRLAPQGGDLLSRSTDSALPELLVRCVMPKEGNKVQIVFEEHVSKRLSPDALATLFAPFDDASLAKLAGDPTGQGRRLGLYLARTLAELAGGTLRERSGELPGELGHRFVLELPAAEESA